MKAFIAFLIGVVLCGVAAGCKTTQTKETALSAAGFKVAQADSTQQVAKLNSLPPDRVTRVCQNGTTCYAFSDRKSRLLYVGNQQQYQDYRRLSLQRQMAAQQLPGPDVNEAPWSGAQAYRGNGWTAWAWGPWDW